MARVLFLVNGLGLGNSTRCEAIIKELETQGAEVRIATSGNGLWFFENRHDKIELEALYYGASKGRISILRTLGAAVDFVGILRRNEATIARALESFRPDVAVIDSVYSLRALRRSGIPILAINNADVVVDSFHRHKADRPRDIAAQFHIVEHSDYLLHRWFCTRIISPALDPSVPAPNDKFVRVNPIVRTDLSARAPRAEVARALVMLSGSRFGSPAVFSKSAYSFRIDVVGRDAPEGRPVPDNVHYHGRLRDNRALIEAADIAVVNGGFSAISEMFCLRKPMVVLPVAGHAEQWANGRAVEDLGIGRVATEETMEPALMALAENFRRHQAAYDAVPELVPGARQAADIVLHHASSSRMAG